MKRRTRFITRT